MVERVLRIPLWTSVSLSVIIIVLTISEFLNNSDGTTIVDRLIIFSMLGLAGTLTWFLVEYTKLHLASHQVHWKRIGWTSVSIWGALAVATLVTSLGVPVISTISNLSQVSLVPSAVIFPIWTLIAVIRNRRTGPKSQISVETTWEASVAFTQVPGRRFSKISRDLKSRAGDKRSLLIGTLTAAVVLGIGAIWVADQWGRSNEVNLVLTSVEKTERTMNNYLRTAGTIDQSVETWATRFGIDEARDRYLSAYQKAGYDLATRLKILEAEWEDIATLPWHSDIVDFKNDYSQHLLAWIATGENRSMAKSIDDLVGPNPYSSDIAATFRIAEKSARSMNTSIFADDTSRRINTIFAD